MAGLVIAASLLLLSGCNAREAEPSFHPLPELAYVKKKVGDNGETRSVRYEYIVIAHPPADREKLKALVDAYNEKTVTAEQLSRQSSYIRWFYKESVKTTRDDKKSHTSDSEIDRIEHASDSELYRMEHAEDVVAVVQWEGGKESNYIFF